MSDVDFGNLRSALERDAHQPPFDQIRLRRARRTRRLAAATTALAVALAVLGVTAVTRSWHATGLGPHIEPGPASVTPSPSPVPNGAAGGPRLVSVAADGHQRVLAVVQRCVASCGTGTGQTVRSALVTTTDLGASWQVVSELTWLGPDADADLVVSRRGSYWIVDRSGGTVGWSTDAGTWRHAASPTGAEMVNAVAVDDVLWMSMGDRVYVWRAGPTPRRGGTVPGRGDVAAIVPIDRDRALAAGIDQEGRSHWYATTDGGASWSPAPSPCAGTKEDGQRAVAAEPAPDGSLWVACVAEPGAGMQAKEVVVSADHGASWRRTGAAEASGYAIRVVAYSATTAWRYGVRADIYRTTDGGHWTVAAPANETGPDGPRAFAAIDASTALYTGQSTQDTNDTLYVTTDGGAHWSSGPLRLPE